MTRGLGGGRIIGGGGIIRLCFFLRFGEGVWVLVGGNVAIGARLLGTGNLGGMEMLVLHTY